MLLLMVMSFIFTSLLLKVSFNESLFKFIFLVALSIRTDDIELIPLLLQVKSSGHL